MKNKIIFLDIDGVLNVHSSDRDQFGHIFHKPFVDNLDKIIKQTGAKIVISSTWKMSGIFIMKKMWIERNLPGEVIDITPNVVDVVDNDPTCEYFDLVSRGDEIQQYINDNNIENYCIIDDVDDFLPIQKDRVVLTYNRDHSDSINGYGLTKICTDKIIEILNK